MKLRVHQSYPDIELDGPNTLGCTLCIMKNRDCREWMESNNTDCSDPPVIYLEIK